MSTVLTAGTPGTDADVVEATEEIGRILDDVHRDVLARVSRTALDPLRNAAAAAASAHAGIVDKSGLADTDAPPTLPGRAIARYRAATMTRVLHPLLEVLDNVDLGGVTGAGWEEAKARIRTVVENAAEEIVAAEPATLLLGRSGDDPALRFRKAAVRSGRTASTLVARASDALLRSLGRTPPERNGRVQRIALRRLVSDHVHLRLPPLQLDLIESLATHLAAIVAVLHYATDEWARAVLAAEVRTDRAALHRADDEVEPPPAGSGAFDEVRTVAAAADVLHAALEDIAASAAAAVHVAEDLDSIAAAGAELVRDARVAGSPLARSRPSASLGEQSRRELDQRLDVWAGWHRRTRDAMRGALLPLELRAATDAALRGAMGDVEAAARAIAARLGATARTLRAERVDAARMCDDCIERDALHPLHEVLDELADRLPAIVEEDAVAPLRAGPHRSLDAAVDEHLARLRSAIADLPEEVAVQASAAPGEVPDPERGILRTRPRDHFGKAFDVVRLEPVRAAAREAGRAFDAAVDEAAQAKEVIAFNLHAAMTELQPADDDAPAANTALDARDLALNGINSAAEGLERLAAEAAARARPFADTAFDATHAAWTDLITRQDVHEREHEHVRDVGFRVRAHVREASERTLAAVRQWADATRRWSRSTLGNAAPPPRSARPGAAAAQPSVETDTISHTDRVVEEAPLIYRRLFDAEIGAERLPLEGRTAELDQVRAHWRDRRNGITDPLVISGWVGGGAASFFDAALDAIAADGVSVERVAFTHRTLEEAGLTQRLGEALGLDEPPRTLDALADDILADDRREWPVVALDGLELLLLRTSSDNGLLGPLLAFLGATSTRVFWIARIARAAWSCVERVEPAAAGLVRHLPLRPLTRNELERLITARHARSGLTLMFDEPAAPAPPLRRRLRRATTPEQRQIVLRAEVFDQLERESQPSIVLALSHWLRASRLDPGGNQLLVRQVEPMRAAFLESLDFDQAYTLKALLEHGMLSIDEHSRVLSVPRDVSTVIVAALATLRLIEPADDDAPATSLARRDAQPWRVRPVMLAPVLTLLRRRNLI